MTDETETIDFNDQETVNRLIKPVLQRMEDSVGEALRQFIVGEKDHDTYLEILQSAYYHFSVRTFAALVVDIPDENGVIDSISKNLGPAIKNYIADKRAQEAEGTTKH